MEIDGQLYNLGTTREPTRRHEKTKVHGVWEPNSQNIPSLLGVYSDLFGRSQAPRLLSLDH